MTRKDHVTFAELFKGLKNNQALSTLSGVAVLSLVELGIATILAADNPRFDALEWEKYING